MAEIRGKVQVEISDDYLSAYLYFTPSDDGQVWTIKQINDLLDEEKITYGVDDKSIAKVFEEFVEGKTGKSKAIARGDKPELPEGSILDPHERDIPQRVLSSKDDVFSKAGPPKIVTKEKIVQKGRFKKEEVQEKSQEIKVDPKVLYTSYYIMNEEVGILIPPNSGKPGKSVTDLPISQGGRKKNDQFYIGSNLRLEKNGHVIAEKSGFYRQGINWAEIIPFDDHIIEVNLSKDCSNCLLTLVPGMKDLAAPEAETIYNLAMDKGYSKENLLSVNQLDSLMKQIISRGKKVVYPISKTSDAIIDFVISPDETKAEIYLKKGTGKGKKLSLQAISTQLNSHGFKGMDIASLKESISQFYHSPDLEAKLNLCEGSLPQRGKDRNIIFSVDFKSVSFVDELKEFLKENPNRIGPYSSLKDFPIDTVESVAIVKKGDRLFSLGAESKGKPGMDVYGKPIPGMKGNDPNIKIFEGINYQEGAARAVENGLLEVFHDKENNSLSCRIRKHKDSAISVFISDNQMKATINVDLPEGSGLYASKERILDALDDNDVYQGLLDHKIQEAAERSQQGEVLADFPVAEGKFPVDEKTDLRLFLDLDQNKNNSTGVKKGEKIGQIKSKSKDQNTGFTVKGDALEITSSNNLEIGDNIETQENEEGTLLVAESSGQLFFNDNKIHIKDTLTVDNDVNSTMGKIYFPGNIHVNGSVQSQSVLRSGENILIKQVVESALITAEGYIKIGKGVKGNKKAALMSHRHIKLSYAEETNLMATEDIEVSKALLHCNIKCNGTLKNDEKGKIIGGRFKVREGLITGDIGSERGAATTISFGQDYLVEDQISQSEKDIAKIQEQMLKVDSIIEKIQNSGGKNEVLLEAREKKKKALKMLEKKNLKIFLLREKFEMHFESELKIYGTVYPGTIFESHGRTLEIKNPLKNIKVFFDQNNGKISHTNL